MHVAPPTRVEDHDGGVEGYLAVSQIEEVEFCCEVELMLKEAAHWHVPHHEPADTASHYVTLCHITLRHTVLHHTVSHLALLHHTVKSHYITLCYVTLCHITLCHTVLHHFTVLGHLGLDEGCQGRGCNATLSTSGWPLPAKLWLTNPNSDHIVNVAKVKCWETFRWFYLYS